MKPKNTWDLLILTDIGKDLNLIEDLLQKNSPEADLGIQEFINYLRDLWQHQENSDIVEHSSQKLREILILYQKNNPSLSWYINQLDNIASPSLSLRPKSEIIVPPGIMEQVYMGKDIVSDLTTLPPGATHKNQVN